MFDNLHHILTNVTKYIINITTSINSNLSVCLFSYYHTNKNYARTGTADWSAVPVNCVMNTAR